MLCHLATRPLLHQKKKYLFRFVFNKKISKWIKTKLSTMYVTCVSYNLWFRLNGEKIWFDSWDEDNRLKKPRWSRNGDYVVYVASFKLNWHYTLLILVDVLFIQFPQNLKCSFTYFAATRAVWHGHRLCGQSDRAHPVPGRGHLHSDHDAGAAGVRGDADRTGWHPVRQEAASVGGDHRLGGALGRYPLVNCWQIAITTLTICSQSV